MWEQSITIRFISLEGFGFLNILRNLEPLAYFLRILKLIIITVGMQTSTTVPEAFEALQKGVLEVNAWVYI